MHLTLPKVFSVVTTMPIKMTTRTTVGNMMRAVRVPSFGEPDVMRIENVPIPKIEDSQVLIRLFAAGVNPVDTYVRSGMFPLKPELPYTPGGDGAGTVEEVGKRVTKFKKGARVFTSLRTLTSPLGTYAEFIACDENTVYPLTDNLSFSHGAAIGAPYFVAYRALVHKGKAVPSETVLIHGASGSVGLALVQMARAYGLTVIGTAGSDEGLKIVKENGAHYVFNHKKPGYMEKIMEAVEGRGVDIVMEMLANVNLAKDLELLAYKGRIIVIGSRGDIEINPRLMMQKESSITGVLLGAADEKEWKEMGNAIISGLELGWVKPVIDREYPIEDVVQTHKDVINHSSGARGKIVLTIANHR